MFVYSISHEAAISAEPLVIESSFERSERLVKWTAIQFLRNRVRIWDWVEESDRMTVQASSWNAESLPPPPEPRLGLGSATMISSPTAEEAP